MDYTGNVGGVPIEFGRRMPSVGKAIPEKEYNPNSGERKIAQKLADVATGFAFDPSLFAQAVVNLHPTQQQAVMRAFMECVYRWADEVDIGYIDGRKEETVFDAARIRDALKLFDRWPAHYPFI